jgi:hypothetical protein
MEKTIKWEYFVAAAAGSFFLCLGDLLNKKSASTVRLIEAMLSDWFEGVSYGGFVSILFIMFLGVVVCFVFEPKTKGDAFARGFAVFAVLTTGTPYNENDLNEPTPVETSLTNIYEGSLFSKLSSLFISSANADSNHTNSLSNMSNQINWASNATILSNEWISGCKPNYDGFWKTFFSIFNNVIYTCPVDRKLPVGERVKAIEFWDDPRRGFRYLKIKYKVAGEQATTGWITAGNKISGHWSKVKLDDPGSIYTNLAVRGNTEWVSTKVNVIANEVLRIESDGQVILTSDKSIIESATSNPDGVPSGIANQIWTDNWSYPLKNENVGMLIGKIDDHGDPFPIGKHIKYISKRSGILYLGINDKKVLDNSGSYNVRIFNQNW